MGVLGDTRLVVTMYYYKKDQQKLTSKTMMTQSQSPLSLKLLKAHAYVDWG